MTERVVRRAFKYRFYPTPPQAEQLNRTFGCVRYVYNRALAERSRAWTQGQRRVTHAETDKMLTTWKRDPETAWLVEPSKGPLQATLRDLQAAYVNFWQKRPVERRRRPALALRLEPEPRPAPRSRRCTPGSPT